VFHTEALDARLALMAVLVTLWGSRLTFNYARKGGYKPGHEDYRWPELRRNMNPVVFQLFNIGFVAIGQNVLLLLFSSPLYVAWRARGTPLNELDFLAALLFLALLAGETTADQQQWEFQTEKYRRIANKEKLTGDYALGFITSGLFRFSRHPNFFCEISIWFVFYLFSVAASGVLLNWTLIGALLLCGLFQGSTNYTEDLSLRKYPAYAQYQQITSRLIPLPSDAAVVPVTPANKSPRKSSGEGGRGRSPSPRGGKRSPRAKKE
jgi:steroid 5-alpha reductase family enzyme